VPGQLFGLNGMKARRSKLSHELEVQGEYGLPRPARQPQRPAGKTENDANGTERLACSLR
jgi:hypothetical protein